MGAPPPVHISCNHGRSLGSASCNRRSRLTRSPGLYLLRNGRYGPIMCTRGWVRRSTVGCGKNCFCAPVTQDVEIARSVLLSPKGCYIDATVEGMLLWKGCYVDVKSMLLWKGSYVDVTVEGKFRRCYVDVTVEGMLRRCYCGRDVSSMLR
eukprot:6863097-Pyramimonas_sp.AAC.1